MDRDTKAYIIGVICGVTAMMFMGIGINSRKIKPIDVYRGKTTLEITYKDSVAIDSTVVWKNK